jgi:4-hydroxy-tetrahydrodipicolinate synthase
MTALVTPLRDGKIDEAALVALVEEQVANGIDALVPCGTTGESVTLTCEEQARVVAVVVRAANRRVPVIAGAGANSTAHAIALAIAAREAGADGQLQVTPYYNKPTQTGLYLHFRAIAEAVPLPMILYNVPGRTHVDLTVDTVARLCELPAVVAIKEASGSVARAQQIHAKMGERLTVLSGDDAINYPLYCVGAHGCISVVSNIAPKAIAEAWDAFAAGDHPRARQLHEQTLPLAEVLFSEPNPIPVKAALAMMGRIGPEIRLPLHGMSEVPRARLRAVLLASGLLPAS